MTVEEAWEGLISPEDYGALMVLLSDPKRVMTRPSGAKYLLSCIAKCFECEADMVSLLPEHYRATRSHGKGLYRCRNSHCAIPMKDLEEHVQHLLISALSDQKNWSELQRRQAGLDDVLQKAITDLETARTQLRQWQAQLDDPNAEIDPVSYARRERVLTEKVAELERQTHRPQTPSVLLPFVGVSAVKAAVIWHGLDLDVKRQVIPLCLKIRVKRIGKGRRNVSIWERVEVHDLLRDNSDAEVHQERIGDFAARLNEGVRGLASEFAEDPQSLM